MKPEQSDLEAREWRSVKNQLLTWRYIRSDWQTHKWLQQSFNRFGPTLQASRSLTLLPNVNSLCESHSTSNLICATN